MRTKKNYYKVWYIDEEENTRSLIFDAPNDTEARRIPLEVWHMKVNFIEHCRLIG